MLFVPSPKSHEKDSAPVPEKEKKAVSPLVLKLNAASGRLITVTILLMVIELLVPAELYTVRVAPYVPVLLYDTNGLSAVEVEGVPPGNDQDLETALVELSVYCTWHGAQFEMTEKVKFATGADGLPGQKPRQLAVEYSP